MLDGVVDDCHPLAANLSTKGAWQKRRVREPYFLSFSLASDLVSAFPSATAWAFAPRISARNGWAADGAGTLPNSKARVVTLRP